MVPFGRICGNRESRFRAIPSRISHLNKVPLNRLALMLSRLTWRVYRGLLGRPETFAA